MNRIQILVPILLLCSVFALGAIYFVLHEEKTVVALAAVKEGYIECIAKETDDEKATCLDDLAGVFYGTYPTSEIAAVLDTLTYQQKNGWCHEIMHYMGWQAYAAEEDIAKAFLNSSELCDSGMYHGVMEEYLRREGLQSNIEELVSAACTESLASHPNVSAGLVALCHHGLGHGLMYITSSNLKKSLEYCDALETSSEEGSCYTGAFMEFNISKTIGPLANERDLTDWSYCEELNEKHKQTCYSRQGLNNLSAAEGDIEKSMRMCLDVPLAYQEDCFEGVGANNPSPSRSHTDAGISCRDAMKISEIAYMKCIQGSLGFVLQIEWGNLQGAQEFCDQAYDDYKDFCYKEAGNAMTPWLSSVETKEQKCQAFPTESAQALCIQGASGL